LIQSHRDLTILRHGQRWQGYQRLSVLHHHRYHLVRIPCNDFLGAITDLKPHSWLDGRHVVFGEVLEGYEIVDKIQNVPKGPGDKPRLAVKIVKSGELELEPETETEDKGSRDEL
jgi:cyclophilin family peptidyl-prolyl cis-trans isomerase